MAFDGHVQPPGGSAGQTGEVTFGTAQLRQHQIRQLQQTQAGAGKAHRAGLAHEQLQAEAFFQFLELMGKRRLRQVQALGGFDETVGFPKCMKRLQVTNFQHAELPCEAGSARP